MRTGVTAMLGATALFAALALTAPGTGGGQEADGGYIGSKGCGMCHKPVRELWDAHGHATMLRAVENGAAPEGASVTLPGGMTWADVTWLIGGTKNYARFTDAKGYVVTGTAAQWSLDGETLTPFKPDVPNGTLDYWCVKCHVVGWKDGGTYEKGVANTLEGVPGAWFENSVGCEACHGPGHEHAALKKKKELKEKDPKAYLKIIRTTKADMCGECHKRNEELLVNVVAADLTQSRQQFTEWKLSKKGKMNYPKCVDCHDPHVTSREADGFVRGCEDCHKGSFAKPVKIAAMQGLACTDCHMPKATRGAWDTMHENYHAGDTFTHIFGISTDPAYTLDDGNGHARINDDGFARMTVEMTCFICHQSGDYTTKSRDELFARIKDVHGE